MKKSKLTPFDGDLLAMVADIVKKEPKVKEYDNEYFIEVQPDLTTPVANIEALKGAIAGRLGARLLETKELHGNYKFRIAYDPTEYPEEQRDFSVAIDPEAGQRYCRTLQEVTAMQVNREKLEELKAFTGGGMLTIPREPNARAIYTFPNGNGMLVDVPETFFIVRDDANDFTTMHPKEFARLYEPKVTHPHKPRCCGECEKMQFEDAEGVGYCDTIKDNTRCDEKACGHYEPKN